MYLCPNCLHLVRAFQSARDGSGLEVLVCPKCNNTEAPIPQRYISGYEQFDTTPVCLMGLTGHGKTRYVDGLIVALYEIGRHWPKCFSDWLDDRRIREIMAELRDYRDGRTRMPTQKRLPEPQVVRLHKVPSVGHSQLILFDHAGETFQAARDILDYGTRFGRASAIIWLASLLEKQPDDRAEAFTEVSPRDFTLALTNYLTALDQMKTDPKRQRIVFTLTKSERLMDRWGTFPKSARDLLDNLTGRDPLLAKEAEPYTILGESSKDLREWLHDIGYHDVVNLLEHYFGAVYYTAVSAQWGEVTDTAPSNAAAFSPRAVLAPLFWVWRRGPGAWLTTRGAARKFFPTVEAALKEARAGAVVELEPGTHDLPAGVVITVPLTFAGAPGTDGDPSPTRLCGRGGLFMIGVQVRDTETVTVRDVVLEWASERPGDGLLVKAGQLLLERVSVSGAVSGGDPAKQPFGAAVMLGTTAVLDARACTFTGNAIGLKVRTGRECKVAACVFEGNGIGLQAVKVHRLYLEKNVFRANAAAGLELRGETRCLSRSDTFEGHPKHAVFLCESARLGASDLTADGFNRGEVGVRASGGAEARLHGGLLRGHTVAAARATDDARLEVAAWDTRAAKDAPPERKPLVVRDNPGDGLGYEDGSRGGFDQCRFLNNALAGVRLAGGATPVPGANNTFRGNVETDVAVGPTVPPEVDLDPVRQPGVRIDDRRRAPRRKGLFG